MSKGENVAEVLRLPSSPKGEIVGIMFLMRLYVTDVVLDGNTHGKALNMMRIKKYAGEQSRRCEPAGTPCRDHVQTHSYPVQEVRTPSSLTSRQRKAHVGFLMFNSWYLADGIVLLWFWPVVLFNDLRKSLPI